MNKINRKVEYALMALKYMSDKKEGQLTAGKEVSNFLGVPFDATSKVMQLMAQKGLLKSEQGVRGGYYIVKDLDKVSFNELVDIVLGPVQIAKCLIHESDCELISKCNIQSPLNNLNKHLVKLYSEITLADLLFAKNESFQQGTGL